MTLRKMVLGKLKDVGHDIKDAGHNMKQGIKDVGIHLSQKAREKKSHAGDNARSQNDVSKSPEFKIPDDALIAIERRSSLWTKTVGVPAEDTYPVEKSKLTSRPQTTSAARADSHGLAPHAPSKGKRFLLDAWEIFKNVSKAAETHVGPPFNAPLVVINKIISTIEAMIENKQSMAFHFSVIMDRLNVVVKFLYEDELLPNDIQETCQRLACALENALDDLRQMLRTGIFWRLLEVEKHPEEIKRISNRINEATQIFHLELNLATVRQSISVQKGIDITRLQAFDPKAEATFTKVRYEPCIKGTRESTLARISTWSTDTSTQSPAVLWLSGMAGTGKSTIAYTFCKWLDRDRDRDRDRRDGGCRLGASFFCSSQVESRRIRANIVPTIAHGLALSFPAFGRAFLDNSLDIEKPLPCDQLETLILSPWRKLIHKDNKDLPPLIIVIDAVDELQDGEGPKFLEDLIRVLTRPEDPLHGLKFFVTSRRDPRIVKLCPSLGEAGRISLENDITSDEIQGDIKLYLKTSLPGLDNDDWSFIAANASDLFIYAATAVRFICPNRPIGAQKKKLAIIRDHWPKKSEYVGKEMLLDVTYERVLQSWLSDIPLSDRKCALSVIQIVFYSAEAIYIPEIPLLFGPQDITRVEVDEVSRYIEDLHAVLYVQGGRVYCYHESFM